MPDTRVQVGKKRVDHTREGLGGLLKFYSREAA